MTDRDVPTVAGAGERALIARLSARLGPPPPWILIGVGDDAAVLRPGRSQVAVLTTDGLVEDVHFKRDWTSARAIGHKALAVNLSDLAAMGAEPRAALLSLALPPDLLLADFDDLVSGVIDLGQRAGAPLVGGNITRSPGPLVVNVTAVGASVPRKLLRRSTGRPGDELYVSGQLGAAAAGLALRAAGRAPETPEAEGAVDRYERPDPRTRLGLAVARAGHARAAIDLSDGLSAAVAQLAEASGTGAIVEASLVPIAPAAAASSPDDGGLAMAVAGGEDYELLFAVRPRSRSRFLAVARRFLPLPMTRVGRLTRDRRVVLATREGEEPLSSGFQHFGV